MFQTNAFQHNAFYITVIKTVTVILSTFNKVKNSKFENRVKMKYFGRRR
jgi:hypothetical protein